MNRILWMCVGLACSAATVQACTNFLVTKGASVDGSTFITYSADSHEFYGELYYRPPGTHRPGDMLDVYEWDTGKFLGQIAQAPRTYAVVGNMNEYQVSIGETTFGGRRELRNPEGIIDYGSLMYIALQRSKTAREAIDTIVSLVNEYGYYSSGESFSIADPNEVWLFEIIGKGPGKKGALWVARKVPDEYIAGHANAARIRQFPLHDADTLYDPEIISFAREKGWFDGDDAEFSFADVYGAVDYGAVRFCDARVWCMYHRAAPSLNIPPDWVQGTSGAETLPLWVKPDRKLSVYDVMELMRDHFTGTPLDMTRDLGAGPYMLPYRWRPLTWKHDGKTYFNERATSTQQTGFSFVAQMRSWLPNSIGGVLWFGVDDTYSTVYVPMYCGITKIPHAFSVGNGSMQEFTWESAFWLFNAVANYSYSRYSDMIKDVRRVQRKLESRFVADQPSIEAAALVLHEQAPRLAIDYLTDYCNESTELVMARWRELFEFLIWKYLDGNVRNEFGKPTHPGYPEEWYQMVAETAGSRLEMRKLDHEVEAENQKKAKAEEKRVALLDGINTLLRAREINLDSETKSKMSEIKEVEKLKQMLIRAATVESAKELMTEEG
jgi:dipeptidase